MSQSLPGRLSEVLKNPGKKIAVIAREVGVSRNTIYRWQEGDVESPDPEKIKALAESLGVSYDWLQFGTGSKRGHPMLDEIESRASGLGAGYKGLDQTLSNVESKAKSLIQDLQALVDDIESMRM